MALSYEQNGRASELCIEILTLMNQLVSQQADIESRSRDGWLSLSRTRMLMGHAYTSVAQFDSRHDQSESSVTLHIDGPMLTLHNQNTAQAKRRFGPLAPSSAVDCERRFNETLQLCIEAANTRIQLINTMQLYNSLVHTGGDKENTQ